MKNLVIIICLLVFACGSNKNASFNSARVSYLNNDKLESLTVKSTDVGENQTEAIFNAKKLAFQNLFFRGVPNSPFNKPLLGINEAEAFKNNKSYLNNFYNSRMETFISNSNESVSKIKGGKRQAIVNLTINILALKKDLEAHQITKKFGL